MRVYVVTRDNWGESGETVLGAWVTEAEARAYVERLLPTGGFPRKDYNLYAYEGDDEDELDL